MRILLYILVGYILYLLLKGVFRKQVRPPANRRGEVETFKDPVCGVYVTDEDAVIGTVDGKRIYFCSMECLEKYRDNLTNTSTRK